MFCRLFSVKGSIETDYCFEPKIYIKETILFSGYFESEVNKDFGLYHNGVLGERKNPFLLFEL